ncbi:efflux RND transporter permease subunit [Oceanicaulis sp. MMSF_3324]|uniref:efflux RND transporter permease subunit n=1 Tax=Oceanicaulis sp. MMSF_3324 TaxID=3046702 RepID=UPI00273D9A6A|nr:efflux RND transporter permease subunit [Oceanicaulis sp. MMSF_3324]
MTPPGSDLPALAVKRPILAVVLNLLVVIAGLAALLAVEVRELPDVDRPIATVRAVLPGAAPETVDAEVTSVLEGAAARVSGVREIRSSSEENSARIRVEFNPGVDLDNAASDLREAVSQVSRRLPDRVEQVSVVKADDDAEAIVSLAVVSDVYDQQELTRLIENDIVPELTAIDGVATVNLSGDRGQQLRVVIDPIRLSRFGLTVGDVADALRQAPFDVPVGSFRSTDQQLIVRAEATAATPVRVKAVIIQDQTRVGDVAEAFFAPADATSFTRLDGRDVIGIGVIRQARSNTINISDAVQERVAQLNDRFDDLEITVTSDEAEFIRESVQEVLLTLTITVLIVVGVIWLFLGKFRATLIPSAAIPAALVGAIAGLWLFGFSINILTLLALVLATGLIVDDAIVVLENIHRLQSKGVGRRAAAVIGSRQVFFAVVATTAVLVAVFVPISFLPSTAGRLFREFGFLLALAVIISSFVALTVVPAFAARLDLTSGDDKTGPIRRAGGVFSRTYARLIRKALDHPWATTGICVLAAGGAVFAAMGLDRELTPEEDRGVVYVWAGGPDGVGLDYMDRQADRIEAILQPYIESGEIESLLTVVGRWDPNRIFITAPLAPYGERTRSQSEIAAELRGPLSEIPGVRASAFGRGGLSFGGGGGQRDGIEVSLTGGDYPSIFEATRALADRLDAESQILDNPEISYEPTQPQLSIQIDRRRAADLGVPLDQLSVTLRAMVDGENLVDLNVNDRVIPIVLESETGAVQDPADLRNLYVRANSGELIPLSALTTIVEEGVAAELDRTEQRRAIELEADIVGGATIAEAAEEMRRLADETLPDDIELLFEGEAETLNQATRDLILTYVFALVIVFLVLAAQFESLTGPLVVMLTVPFALAAAVYALFFTGTSLNIFSQIGLVMLIGLMAKNGILVVEFADQLRAEGKSVRAAIEEAAIIRLRPIAMTLISTVLGALPLILATGAGAQARVSIGWTVFGGLGLAAAFTLFLTPVVYLGLARFGSPRAAAEARLASELDAADAIVLSDNGPAE